MTWQQDAQCRHGDPERFEVPRGLWKYRRTSDRRRWQQRLRDLGSVCDGCPVVRQCAADVALGLDVGVIRAGVPLPDYGQWNDRTRHGVEQALGMIEGGVMHRYAIVALRGPYD